MVFGPRNQKDESVTYLLRWEEGFGEEVHFGQVKFEIFFRHIRVEMPSRQLAVSV